VLPQRQAKGGGLAAAGLGLGDQVFAGQRGGQAGGLNGGHAQVPQLLQDVQRGGVERQGVEGLGGGVCHGRIIGFARVGTMQAVVILEGEPACCKN